MFHDRPLVRRYRVVHVRIHGSLPGKTVLFDTTYHRIMAACGVFLVLFGIYYLSGVFIR